MYRERRWNFVSDVYLVKNECIYTAQWQVQQCERKSTISHYIATERKNYR